MWHGHLARDIADTGWKPVSHSGPRIDQLILTRAPSAQQPRGVKGA
jgi:hypothetical protein